RATAPAATACVASRTTAWTATATTPSSVPAPSAPSGQAATGELLVLVAGVPGAAARLVAVDVTAAAHDEELGDVARDVGALEALADREDAAIAVDQRIVGRRRYLVV